MHPGQAAAAVGCYCCCYVQACSGCGEAAVAAAASVADVGGVAADAAAAGHVDCCGDELVADDVVDDAYLGGLGDQCAYHSPVRKDKLNRVREEFERGIVEFCLRSYPHFLSSSIEFKYDRWCLDKYQLVFREQLPILKGVI